MKRLTVSLAWVLLLATLAAAGEIGFVEDFALAKDRNASLRQLIPGTEDYYYYQCLNFLNTEQYEKAEALTRPWLQRFGQTPRLTEIQTRHALLTYERNPQRTLDYLRQRLNLRFDHQKVIPGGAPNLPTALDAQVIARERLKADSFARWQNLDNFEDAALEWLAAENLNWERRRMLLARLARPDIANLPKLVADDLAEPTAPRFGPYAVHRQMTLSQLEELLRLRPAVLNENLFVHTYVTKLQPGADEDWRHDPKLARAYFDRLIAFARRLSPAHNPLKAHALYQRLVLDRTQGTYDKALFLEYLKLPRPLPYVAKSLLESTTDRGNLAGLDVDYSTITLLPPIHTDEPLVRSYLEHFLLNADTAKEFEAYIDDTYLKHLFAEVKIVNGLGEAEQWAALLPPEAYRQLKERVDLDFAFTNKTTFAADEPVRLDLFVKNVPTLTVKVFEVNAEHFYRSQQREVDTDINLDGLVPGSEDTYTYAAEQPPLRRQARRFDFPQLNKPGVYVIDFIGAGKSSRALVRKGRLRPLVATGTAGQSVTVVDEANRPVKDAILWLGGHEYLADKEGVITVPFSTSPGRRPVVISRGDFACLDYLEHQAETYALTAGIHVDRESLLSQRVASVLVRPGLTINGHPVSVKLLEEVKLRITSTDLDNISTSTEVSDFKLFEDRESVHEFRVPPRLQALHVSLRGKVQSLSLNQKVDLEASQTFALNGIDKTDKIEDLHLAKFGAEYVIEVRGRTGEMEPDRPVQLSFKHRDFKEQAQTTLKSDAQGRVKLGALPDITSITAKGPEGTTHNWPLRVDRHTYRQVLHAKAGDTVTLPYEGSAAAPKREELALFEMRGEVIAVDRFEALAIQNGLIEMRGLAAGDYDLWLKRTGEKVRVRVVAGPVVNGYVLGQLRHMELPDLKPVQIESVTGDADTVTIRLRDASAFARIHVFSTRYRPEYSAFDDLAKVRDDALSGVYPSHAESSYLAGRNIGDEYRYILDRRLQHKFPGNMAERPALLLNPWAVRSTETGEQTAAGGEDYSARGVPAPGEAITGHGIGPGTESGVRSAREMLPSLDFLADASAVLVNLVPDKDGVVKVPRKDIGAHAMIQVVAVDPVSTTSRSVALPEQPAKVRDLRLHAGLDPQGHFTQQKQVSLLPPGEPFTLADAAASRFEAYDSLPKVYGLYATLTKDPKLAEFAFALTWPKLKPEEKRTLYSKYACHELNFFLAKKDPAFFRDVVGPYLANKRDKTFLDHWLLEDDLRGYLEPWQFDRLNTVERVLLAQRIAGEPAKTARHINDLLRLQPPRLDRDLMLFDTAVKSGALNQDQWTAIRMEEKYLGGNKNAPVPAPPPVGGFAGYQGSPGAGGDSTKAQSAAGRAELETALRDADSRYPAARSSREGRTLKDGGKKDKQIAGDADGKSPNFFTGVPVFRANEREQLQQQLRQLYRRLDPTQEWAENNYYHLRISQQLADLVPVSPFWLDYAQHDGKGPFLSKNLAEPSRNFTEMMLALAVLDLPFEAGKPEVKFDGNKMTLTPTGNLVAFHEEVRPVAAAAAPAAGKPTVLVSENFYRHGDRYREEGGERFDKFVTGEFVVHTVYGCQVVVTNATPSRQKLTVLIQVPTGAIALAGGQPTKAVPLDLEPYRTQTVDYLFYFPLPGHFAHFPVHVAKNETLVAAAAPTEFEVVAQPTKLDTESWAYVSQNGTGDQVLAMLGRENIHALDLELIAFRMKDREFFERVIALLTERHVYHATLWSYGLFHNAAAVAREYLTHVDQIVNECGGPINSVLLVVDPVARHQHEHLEYKPLVNARAHALGKERQIVNGPLLEQYQRFLKLLSYRRDLTDEDKLAVTYYLLLQDRIEEALATFAQVDAGKVAERLQYDYCAAYLDLFGEEPQKARAIASRYAKHPVDRWRNVFNAILNQLNEGDGKGPLVADAEDRSQRQGQLAATEPGFDFTLDGGKINLTWQNLHNVRVNYYLMDVELLFSRSPFAQQFGDQFASIRPNATQEVKLPAGQTRQAVALPEDLARRNVLVEVTAAGKTHALPYYAGAMNVQMTENYGQLRVAESVGGKALPKVYVKVYARLADGQVKFYKDGYTDHRGRFDYSSVSTPEHQPVQRFAVLVLSDDRGATIREAAPPQQ